MNTTFYLDQIVKAGDLNDDLITKNYKLDNLAKFMQIKSINPKLLQSEIPEDLAISTSTLKR